MAVLPFPDLGVVSLEFELIQPVNLARTQGRAIDSQILDFPYWTANYGLAPMKEIDYGRLESFLLKVSAGRDYFLAHKTGRPRPIAEDSGVPLTGTRHTGGAFNGSGLILSIQDSKSVQVNDLPTSFQLTEGDMIEFVRSIERRSLHMITSDVAAVNGAATINFLPALDSQNFHIPMNYRLEKPSCVMQVIDPPSKVREVVLGQGSFTAQEIHL